MRGKYYLKMSCFVSNCVSGYPKTRMLNKKNWVKNVYVFKPKVIFFLLNIYFELPL